MAELVSGPSETAPTGEPVLSVVVFGYHNEATIGQVVDSLLRQDHVDPIEIVVATSGGDGTGEIMRRRFPDIPVTEWPCRLLPGGVRNLGRSMARGEFIAFLEADMVPTAGWVANRIRAHRAGHEAVAGAIALRRSDPPASRATTYLTFDHRLLRLSAGPAKPFFAYALSFTKDLLDRAGPFDESVRIEEDSLMTDRIAELGVTPWFEPSISCEHAGPANFRELVKEQSARGRRSARGDLLKWPAGSPSRSKLEADGRTAVAAVSLRAARHAQLRSRWLAKNLYRSAPDRRDVLRTSPWIVGGLVANHVGWGREQLAFVRADAFQRSADAVFVNTPFRSRVATNLEKLIALTFEGGPTRQTLNLSDLLAKLDVPATFFVSGELAASTPEVVRSIASNGHTVGSSGWSGLPFTELEESRLDEEIDRTNRLLRELTGSECRHVRPPMGNYDANVVTRLADRGLIMWHSTSAPKDISASTQSREIAATTLRNLTPGAVVVLPDCDEIGPTTIAALPDIVEGTLARRFRFVSLDYVFVPQPDSSQAPLSPLVKS